MRFRILFAVVLIVQGEGGMVGDNGVMPLVWKLPHRTPSEGRRAPEIAHVSLRSVPVASDRTHLLASLSILPGLIPHAGGTTPLGSQSLSLVQRPSEGGSGDLA